MKKWNLVIGGKKAKVLSVLLTVTLSFSAFGIGAGEGGMNKVQAAGTETTAVATTETADAAASTDSASVLEEAAEQLTPSHASENGKEETVYVITGADGTKQQVIVSDHLKNKDGAGTLTDKTELQGIDNVGGYGDYTENGDGTITWKTDGSDVYYQGTTDKELPVDVTLSYKLDGKDIRPEDLAGKSGHVTIRFDYRNNATAKVMVGDKEEEIAVPFGMISGAVLPTDKFSNVSVTNGKIMSDGSNNIVVGVAFPGLTDALDWESMKDKATDDEAREKLDDIDIPEYVEIEADVTDFELDMTMTMASSNLLQDMTKSIDLENIDTSKISEDIDKLQDGADELSDGASDLKDGTSDLADGAHQLKDGGEQLTDGVSDLKDGTADLAKGASDLDDGAAKLADGTSELAGKAPELQNGVNQLKDGAAKVNDGAGQLKDGIDQANLGAIKLSDGAGKLKSGALEAANGINTVSAGAAKLAAGIGTQGDMADPKSSNNTLYGVVNALNASVGPASPMNALMGQVKALPATVQALSDGVTQLQGLTAKLRAAVQTVHLNAQNIIDECDAGQDQEAAKIQTAQGTITATITEMQNQYNDNVANISKLKAAITAAEAAANDAKNNAIVKQEIVTENNTYIVSNGENSGTDAAPAQDGSGTGTVSGTTDTDVNGQTADQSTSGTGMEKESGTETGSNIAADTNNAETGTDMENGQPDSDADPSGNVTPEDTADGGNTAEETGANGSADDTSAAKAGTLQTSAEDPDPAGEELMTVETVSLQESPDVTVTNPVGTDGNGGNQETQDPQETTGGAGQTTQDPQQTTGGSDQTTQNPDGATQNPGRTTNQTTTTVDTTDQGKIDQVASTAMTVGEMRKQLQLLQLQNNALDQEIKSLQSAQTDITTASSTDTNASKLKRIRAYASVIEALTVDDANPADSNSTLRKGSIVALLDLMDAGLSKIQDNLPDTAELQATAKTAEQNVGALQSTISTLDNKALPALSSGAQQLAAGSKQLSDGAGQLSTGASQLADGSAALKDGTGKLATGASDLKNGTQQLADGTSKLASGADQLVDGVNKLNNGAQDLKDGTGKLSNGAVKLDNGVQDLSDGAAELYDGIVKLADGTDDLDDGAGKLLDGIKELNDEGISKLSDIFGNNLTEVLDRLKAVEDAGDSYTTFTGALDDPEDADDVTNTVRFVFRTDSIKVEED